MPDHATPNLLSNNLARTAAFYEALGFETGFRDEGWMIMTRGGLTLEFVPLRVNPRRNVASACLRVDDLDALYAAFSASELTSSAWGIPRLTPPQDEHGLRIFALIDPDGNLLRCIAN